MSDEREIMTWDMLGEATRSLSQMVADDDLSSVLPRLNPLRPVVTVWNDGQLLGIVPPKALRQRLDSARAAALRRP